VDLTWLSPPRLCQQGRVLSSKFYKLYIPPCSNSLPHLFNKIIQESNFRAFIVFQGQQTDRINTKQPAQIYTSSLVTNTSAVRQQPCGKAEGQIIGEAMFAPPSSIELRHLAALPIVRVEDWSALRQQCRQEERSMHLAAVAWGAGAADPRVGSAALDDNSDQSVFSLQGPAANRPRRPPVASGGGRESQSPVATAAAAGPAASAPQPSVDKQEGGHQGGAATQSPVGPWALPTRATVSAGAEGGAPQDGSSVAGNSSASGCSTAALSHSAAAFEAPSSSDSETGHLRSSHSDSRSCFVLRRVARPTRLGGAMSNPAAGQSEVESVTELTHCHVQSALAQDAYWRSVLSRSPDGQQ
jgi:hypothetical protein